jgi:hypothetical protein
MKWIVLAAAALCICTQAAHASPCATDYQISFAIPDSSGVNVPPALVTGDICTNGTIGALMSNDIVGFNLTLSDSWNSQTPDFSLSSTNPNDSVTLDLLKAGSQLQATANALTWDFKDLNTGAYAFLQFQDSSSTDYITLYDYPGFFTGYSYGTSQVGNYGPTESGKVILGRVPEPASLVLLISGIAGLGFVRRRQELPNRG